ncbi:hypothetical protein CHGG_07930 [Chaetomium globosum CBS 148.51]|jgi:hypothetical protein|uniref:Transmembrane protein n=1 Tax=Chaetomium globosum (strain ATCC 6205 / CBS 148.51 / DSM 1962 / NBRC 6347 / NRRL 1970) TaxID=306901 RepID=Q2GVS4_CHAGB|nr:uncharacterized protein CHGG_07930 [Chaetomium globosum CBS 148.51]EAQ86677.1 hypothetical protein CHGG_07930 [Chaetomium globosum CBS 148.51]
MMKIRHSLLFPIGLCLFLLAVDAAITMGLVSNMVSFLHRNGRGPFAVAPADGSPFLLAGEPANLVVDQGHTANAAGGTALILVGFGGSIALWLERRVRKKWDRSSPFFHIWAVFVLLSFLLTMVALIYTFVETAKTGGQVIDLGVARANPPPAKYPDDKWTPENWYAAVLDLPLASANQRRVINGNLTIMRAWRWNLVSLFILGFTLLSLVALEVLRARQRDLQPVSMVEVLAGPSKRPSA